MLAVSVVGAVDVSVAGVPQAVSITVRRTLKSATPSFLRRMV
jgi:hypothetical protein